MPAIYGKSEPAARTGKRVGRRVWAGATAVVGWFAAAAIAAAAQAADRSVVPAAAASPSAAASETPSHVAQAPGYRYLPDQEDWKPLCGVRSENLLDTIKCIPLAARDANRYLSIGADIRLKYEHFFNKDWNSTNNGYLLERELVHFDLHLDRLRTFVELEHATATNQHAPFDPTWRDDFATTSAYVQYAVGGATGAAAPPIAVMIGRQRLAYGSERMIDDRSGLNTIQPFDGVRVRFSGRDWTTDAFAARPVNVGANAFDDLPDRTRSFSGIYATRTLGSEATLDIYGLIDQRQSQFYYRGVGPEVRDTIGVRYATNAAHYDTDTEIDKQLGTFAGATIDAYAIETNLGYDFGAGRNRFRVGAGGGIASGDRNPRSSLFTEFRAPYPTGLTFGIIEANGNENTSGFTPQVSYTYNRKVTAAVKDYFFYRQNFGRRGVFGARLPAAGARRGHRGAARQPRLRLGRRRARSPRQPVRSLCALFDRAVSEGGPAGAG